MDVPPYGRGDNQPHEIIAKRYILLLKTIKLVLKKKAAVLSSVQDVKQPADLEEIDSRDESTGSMHNPTTIAGG